MNGDLVIHPASLSTLTLMLDNPPQSLLITGPAGVGLGTIASDIAHSISSEVITVLPEKDEKVDIDKGVISVDSVRKLYTQTRSIHTNNQVIVIDYAERMGHQAQNAFLKLLEEPLDNVYFILASHTPERLLPTIISRTQHVSLQPVTQPQSEQLLDTRGVDGVKKRSQLLFMATGLPAELTRLTSNDEYFDSRVQIMRDARELLQGTTYAKLRVAHGYKDNREGALLLLNDAANILRRSISEKPQESLIQQIDALLHAYKQIHANGNIRLCLARLVV